MAEFPQTLPEFDRNRKLNENKNQNKIEKIEWQQ